METSRDGCAVRTSACRASMPTSPDCKSMGQSTALSDYVCSEQRKVVVVTRRQVDLSSHVDCESFLQAINFMERNENLDRVTDNRAIEVKQRRRRNGRFDSFQRIFLSFRFEKCGCVEVVVEARDVENLDKLELTNADK